MGREASGPKREYETGVGKLSKDPGVWCTEGVRLVDSRSPERFPNRLLEREASKRGERSVARLG